MKDGIMAKRLLPGITKIGVGVFSAILMSWTCVAQQAVAPRVVDLTAADGVKLKATYFAAAKAGPGVLLLHQCNQQRKNWDDLASQIAAAGINVLTLDYRGYGESGGSPCKGFARVRNSLNS